MGADYVLQTFSKALACLLFTTDFIETSFLIYFEYCTDLSATSAISQKDMNLLYDTCDVNTGYSLEPVRQLFYDIIRLKVGIHLIYVFIYTDMHFSYSDASIKKTVLTISL